MHYRWFILAFLYPFRKIILCATFLLATGTTLMWVNQGKILIPSNLNETKHYKICWCWFNIGCLLANIFVYFQLFCVSYMDFVSRMKMLTWLIFVAVFSFFLLAFGIVTLKENNPDNIYSEFKGSKKCSWQLLLISIVFIYLSNINYLLILNNKKYFLGIQQCYIRGIFTNLPGYSSKMRLKETDITSLTSIFIYAGEVIGKRKTF